MVSEDAAPEAATMAAHSTAVNPTRRERMHNPLLDGQPLPPFLEIRPEHVEPAVREVLTENRARRGARAAHPPPPRAAHRAAPGAPAPRGAHLVAAESPRNGAALPHAPRRRQ